MAAIIEIRNLQKKFPISPAKIRRTVKKILEHETVRSAGLSLVFVTRLRIKSLNKQFLKREYDTDVLAFDLSERRLPHSGRKKAVDNLEGEIVISTDAVLKNAEEFKTSPDYELKLYIVHGILHLLGFDDHSPKETRRIRKKEKELLEKIGEIRPWPSSKPKRLF